MLVYTKIFKPMNVRLLSKAGIFFIIDVLVYDGPLGPVDTNQMMFHVLLCSV